MEAGSPCPTSGPGGTGTFLDRAARRCSVAPEPPPATISPGAPSYTRSRSTWVTATNSSSTSRTSRSTSRSHYSIKATAPCRNSSQVKSSSRSIQATACCRITTPQATSSSSSFLATGPNSGSFRNSSRTRGTSCSGITRFPGKVASSCGGTVTPGSFLVRRPAVLITGCGTAVRLPGTG